MIKFETTTDGQPLMAFLGGHGTVFCRMFGPGKCEAGLASEIGAPEPWMVLMMSQLPADTKKLVDLTTAFDETDGPICLMTFSSVDDLRNFSVFIEQTLRQVIREEPLKL